MLCLTETTKPYVVFWFNKNNRMSSTRNSKSIIYYMGRAVA
jgi:hypothetical protein